MIKRNSQVLQISGLLGLHSPPPQLTLKGESTCTNKRALNYNKKKNKDKRELLQRNVLQHQQFLGYAKLLEPIYSCRSFYQRHLLLFAASFWWGEGITMVCSTEKKKWQNAVPLYEVSFNSTQKLTTQLNTNTKLYQKSQALEITLFQLISWHILGSQGLNQLSQSKLMMTMWKAKSYKLRLPWVETHLDGQGIDELLYLPKPTKYMCNTHYTRNK